MEFYIHKLRTYGLKVTPKRRAIIALFLERNRVWTPEEVWTQLRRQFKQFGLPSVYRNLEVLVDCGILTKIQRFDRNRYYGLCTVRDGHHHHHIICVKCGKVGEVAHCDLFGNTTIKGFTVINHFLQMEGICDECRNKKNAE